MKKVFVLGKRQKWHFSNTTDKRKESHFHEKAALTQPALTHILKDFELLFVFTDAAKHIENINLFCLSCIK